MINGNAWEKTYDWFWEGNVQNRIIEYMVKNEGFQIIRSADPGKKERGPDIFAQRRLSDGSFERRRVAVKGYPSERYVDGERRGEKKRTDPSTQARHWFGEALLELVLAKSKDENLQIALGLPDKKVYRNLLKRIKWFREKVGLLCYLVDEHGEVNMYSVGERIPQFGEKYEKVLQTEGSNSNTNSFFFN